MRLRTLAQPVEISGIGLHSGQASRLRLLPAARPGWVFRRMDSPGAPEASADVDRVHQTTWSTSLSLGGSHGLLHCTEHVLSALHGMGIGACVLEVEGGEIPIADGSAGPFVEMIQRAGIREMDEQQTTYQLTRACWVQEGDKHVFAFPSEELRVTCAVDYQHDLAPRQVFSSAVTPALFAAGLAPARTFALSDWVENLQSAGLIQGGSLDNALVIFPDRYSSALRFPDELARHKALDLIGDLALLGAPVVGHFVAVKASHAMHVELVRRLRREGCVQPLC